MTNHPEPNEGCLTTILTIAGLLATICLLISIIMGS